MVEDHFRQQFETWISHPDNYGQLRKIASCIYNKIRLRGISLPGADLVLSENPVEEICQELFVFLLESPDIRKDLLSGSPGIIIRINRYFYNHIIDRIRGRDNNQDIYKDTWRLFYRHARDVLDHSDMFQKYKLPGREICFSLTNEEPSILILPEDLPQVCFPDDLTASLEQVGRKKIILKLAIHYWTQCAEIMKEPNIRISVRDFVSWVGNYVPLQLQVDSEWFSEAKNKAVDSEFDLMKTRYLKIWAGNFLNLLKEKEKKIFSYYECQGLKGYEISTLVGAKTDLSYQRNKIREKLRQFLIQLEWLSPSPANPKDAPDQEAALFFIKEVCRILENNI